MARLCMRAQGDHRVPEWINTQGVPNPSGFWLTAAHKETLGFNRPRSHQCRPLFELVRTWNPLGRHHYARGSGIH